MGGDWETGFHAFVDDTSVSKNDTVDSILLCCLIVVNRSKDGESRKS